MHSQSFAAEKAGFPKPGTGWASPISRPDVAVIEQNKADGRPEAQAVTPRQVRDAINQLTETDLHRLERFAMWRVRGLGRFGEQRTHEDLLSEAIHATLSGARRWNPRNVDFPGFLMGAMRSISSNWARHHLTFGEVRESELLDDSWPGGNLLDRFPAGLESEEERLIKNETKIATRSLFADDPEALNVILELEEGTRLKEIQAKFALSAERYAATIKRIRRRVARFHAEC